MFTELQFNNFCDEAYKILETAVKPKKKSVHKTHIALNKLFYNYGLSGIKYGIRVKKGTMIIYPEDAITQLCFISLFDNSRFDTIDSIEIKIEK